MPRVKKNPAEHKKRGPAEPPPLVIDTDDPLGAFDRLLGADPKKTKSKARRRRTRRKS